MQVLLANNLMMAYNQAEAAQPVFAFVEDGFTKLPEFEMMMALFSAVDTRWVSVMDDMKSEPARRSQPLLDRGAGIFELTKSDHPRQFVQYLDSMVNAPRRSARGTAPARPGGGGNGGSCANTQATLALTTDGYASETSWTLKTSSGSEVASNGTLANNTTYNETFCLADGDYTFTISDSYGDGICCNFGNGSYELSANGSTLASGASFTSSESTNFTIGAGGGDNGGGTNPDPGSYYDSITTQTGYTLKTALHNLINNHTTRGYSAIWTFYSSNALDTYYEKDGTILDIYSENPNGSDPYNFTKVSNQCGSYSGEGDCYNREHSFPRSWFGGDIEPMNSDIHHIFATDGKVNSVRSSYPYGEVASASYTSANGSKLGSASSSLGYSGTVFEPIDEFKGDIARAYFYMATRYEDQIASWQSISSYGDAVLNGTSTAVFEPWVISMLLSWHANDPVSQKEIDRNEAAYAHQGNRNPFVDHPEYVTKIWN